MKDSFEKRIEINAKDPYRPKTMAETMFVKLYKMMDMQMQEHDTEIIGEGENLLKFEKKKDYLIIKDACDNPIFKEDAIKKMSSNCKLMKDYLSKYKIVDMNKNIDTYEK